MIYFVDEDVSQIDKWAAILRMRGFNTTIYSDADSAYYALEHANDVELVFIDVMLSVASHDSRYDEVKTDGYGSTGLVLLEDLCNVNPGIFPSKAILLSHTGKTRILSKIHEATNKLGVDYWKKITFTNVCEFANAVHERLDKGNT